MQRRTVAVCFPLIDETVWEHSGSGSCGSTVCNFHIGERPSSSAGLFVCSNISLISAAFPTHSFKWYFAVVENYRISIGVKILKTKNHNNFLANRQIKKNTMALMVESWRASRPGRSSVTQEGLMGKENRGWAGK
jgi:hypothetical protein